MAILGAAGRRPLAPAAAVAPDWSARAEAAETFAKQSQSSKGWAHARATAAGRPPGACCHARAQWRQTSKPQRRHVRYRNEIVNAHQSQSWRSPPATNELGSVTSSAAYPSARGCVPRDVASTTTTGSPAVALISSSISSPHTDASSPRMYAA